MPAPPLTRSHWAGSDFGAFEVSAQTAGHHLAYDATTQLQGADLHLKGQTELRSGYATQARVDFSQFNVGALLRMAHVDGFQRRFRARRNRLHRRTARRSQATSRRRPASSIGGDRRRRSSPKRGRRARHACRWPHPPRSAARDRRQYRPSRRGQASRSRARSNSILPPAAPSISSSPRRSIPT